MIYIGCITGTSVDALDIAAAEINTGSIKILAATHPTLPEDLRRDLLHLGQPEHSQDIEMMARADAALGEFIGQQVADFVQAQGFARTDIAGVGSHGQTIRHRPGQFTLQIGDPNRIAEISGVTTVADFRRRDMAAGGQGAPLVPPFHQALFAGSGKADPTTTVLNIGGISNITLLGDPPSGFDTGPGNGLLDAWCQKHLERDYDHNGDWARSGTLDQTLLSRMLADPYCKQPPPKSTGREYFNLDWLLPKLENQTASNVQRTLCEFTARCTTDVLTPGTQTLVVCGGGRLNTFLMERLQANHTANVVASEALGIDGDSLEAAAFAWLAFCTLNHLPGNEPNVTGATGYRVLGGVYPGG